MKCAIVVPIVGNFGRKGYYHSQEIGLGNTIAKYGHEVTVYKCVAHNSMYRTTKQANSAGSHLGAAHNRINEEQHGLITVKYIPTKSIGVHGLLDVSIIDKTSDIVFVFSDTQFIVPKLYRYCKGNGIVFIPYVGIAHSFQRNLKSKIMDCIFRFTALRVYKKCTVIAKTIDAMQELEKLGVEKCVVAPVGIDAAELKTDYEKYDRNELREKWGFAPDDLIICFIARLSAEKHPLELLDIFEQIDRPNKKLLIVGKGPLEDGILKKAERLGITGLLHFIREVKYEDMWEVHYISDYFVNLRSDEIFGMAIMEAVYYKSCVVAMKAPGPDTILRRMQGGCICQSYDEVIAAINRADICDEELWHDSREIVRAFSWEGCYREMLKIQEG